MISSISNTGFLPDPLSEFTTQFLENLCENVLDSILNRIPSDESQFSIMKDFIFLFFQISLYGIFSLEKSCVKIAHSILNSKHSHFINSKIAQKCLFYPAISEEYLKIGVIDRLNSILPEQIQSTELLMYFVNIYTNLSYFIIKFDISKLFQITSESLLITSKIDHDTLNFSLILDTLRDRLFNFIDDQSNDIKSQYINLFVDTFLPIIIKFLLSDNLEQRIHIFNEFDNILNDSRFNDDIKKKVALFLTSDEQQQQNDFSLLSNLKFHKEYKNAVSSIFNCLSLYGANKLNHEIIRQLWINNQDLISSDRFIFFNFFFSLSDHDKEGEILTTIIDCVLNHNEFTEQNIFEWFDMIDVIIQNLESRHNSVKYQIEMVRQVLWSISFQSTSPITNFIDYNSNIVERARKSLTKIINVEPDEDDFSRIIDMLKSQNDPFLYTLLNEFLKDPQLQITEEEIQSMINQTMNQLMDEFSDPNSDPILKSKIYNFFLCLCKFSNTTFNELQIDKLCSLQDFIPDFFSLLLRLSYSNTINEYDLEKIIEKINPTTINKTFFKFIKKIVIEVNGILDSNIRFLPLKHENTLWHFATSDTKIRNLSMKFLCKLYSLNDGIELNDKSMIETFFEHWLVFYSNNPEDDQLLNLLKLFIETIENQSFRDKNFPKSHQFSENEILVQVHFPEKTINISVPFSAQVGMVFDKISIETKIEMNDFELLIGERKLKRKEFLKKLISLDSKSYEIHLEFQRIKSKSNRNCHRRTKLPSILFINNPMMPIQEIYKKLEIGNKYAFDLLQVLPTLNIAPNIINIEKIIDVFNTSKPLVFFYNLETLLNQNQIFEICQNFNFIDYLYSNIDNLFESMKSIKNSNNDELIILLIVFLKRASVFTDDELRKKIFYLLVKCAIETKEIISSLSMINQILQQTNARNSKIDFPNDDFYDIFVYLILNEQEKIRNLSILIFKYLNIPSTIFLKCIDDENKKQNLSTEFLIVFNDHFNDDRQVDKNEELSTKILSLLDESHGSFLNALLLIILKLLKLEIINYTNKFSLLIFLIKRFLILDFDENDRIAFENASECMSFLSNIEDNQRSSIDYTKDYNEEIRFIISNEDKICCSNKILLLKEILNLHHTNKFFVETVFSHYMINGDECCISSFNQVGLKNIGMTCYLNSILQQFYSLKPLRNSILSYSEDHPLLSSISHLFFLMKYAKTKSIDPSFVVEKWEIRPNVFLNPRIQQDAAEIIQFLLHTFENGKELKEEVMNLFQGELLHPIDGIDIIYHNETKETFSVIQLEVQNCTDLIDGFKNFSKPELFLNDSQYYADDLGIKINAKRSTFINKAPPILVIQLMRFNYNFSQNKRTKITDPFTVFKQIDISSVCTDKTQEKNYLLVGVIIHKGSAVSGHYISFVYKKKRKIWLCFNDEKVTQIDEKEVFNQASGNNPESTGYVLFYEKQGEEFETNKKIINIPDNIKNEIDQINNETKKAKLLCSKGYFKLMLNLSLETSMSYFDVCLKYIVDTLPFTSICLNDKFFITMKNKLKKSDDSIKEDFLDFILNPMTEYLKKSLFYCPSKEIRQNFSILLLSLFECDTKLDPIQVVFSVIQLVDHFWENYQQVDDFFKVLYELYKKFEKVKNFAKENNWSDKLCDIFGTKFSEFRENNPELTTSYIFKGIDLTHYLKLIVAFDIPKITNNNISEENNYYFSETAKIIMNDSFFLNICLSSSSTPSIARFTHKYFTANDFLFFLQGNAHKLKPFRIASLIYFIMPNRATFDLLNFPFKTQTRDLSTCDVIVMMIAIVSIWPSNDLEKSIIEMSDTWLPAFLYDENCDTRNLCLSLCAYLAPCNLFDQNLYQIKIPEDLEIPKIGKIKRTQIDDFIKSCFKRFLSVCFNSIGILNDKVKDHNERPQFQGGYDSSLGDEIASQFLSLVSVLLQVVWPENDDFSPLFSLYATLTKSSPSNPFNEQAHSLLMLIFKYKMQIDVETLITPFLRDDILDLASRQEEVIYFSLEQFISPFLIVFSDIDTKFNNDENLIPDQFFDIFFRVVVFQSIPFFARVVDEIYSFLKNCVSKRPSVKKNLMTIIDDYFDTLIANNFWGLCIALNAFGEMKPEITDFIPDHIDELKNCEVDINKMVQMAITSSLSQTINKTKLDEMINNFNFDEKTMKMLLSLSYM